MGDINLTKLLLPVHFVVGVATFSLAFSATAKAECLVKIDAQNGTTRIMAPSSEVQGYVALGYRVEPCTDVRLSKVSSFRQFVCNVPQSPPIIRESLTRRFGVPPERVCASLIAARNTQ